jgi:hypothetical protein
VTFGPFTVWCRAELQVRRLLNGLSVVPLVAAATSCDDSGVETDAEPTIQVVDARSADTRDKNDETLRAAESTVLARATTSTIRVTTAPQSPPPTDADPLSTSPIPKDTAPSRSTPPVSRPCLEAMQSAANVSEFEDTPSDLWPTFTACTSLEEWTLAAELTGESDRISVDTWVENQCTLEPAVSDSPLCRAAGF